MNVDNLSPVSRDFFEATKLKMIASLVLGAIAMMLLGFSSSTGGEAAFSNSIAHDSTLYGSDSTSAGIVALASGTGNITEISMSPYYAIKAGDGFSCFSFLVGFLVASILAIFMSPLCCGSANEKRMLRIPQEMEETPLRGSNQHKNNNVGVYNYNNTGSASSEGHSSSKPITGSNPASSSSTRPSAAKAQKAKRSSNSASDPLSSRADWPEPGDEDDMGADGNDLDVISVSIDR